MWHECSSIGSTGYIVFISYLFLICISQHIRLQFVLTVVIIVLTIIWCVANVSVCRTFRFFCPDLLIEKPLQPCDPLHLSVRVRRRWAQKHVRCILIVMHGGEVLQNRNMQTHETNKHLHV